MGLRSKLLTDQEKTAIVALVYGFIPNWREAYRIADGMSEAEALKNIHFSDYTSKWKQSAKVQIYLQTVINQKAVQENDLIKKYEKERGDNVRKDTKSEKSFLDYTDPANQRRKLNELINEASDPGEALDALKVIISGQKDDRQAAREQKQVRAYLPITCQDCPLYQKAKKRQG